MKSDEAAQPNLLPYTGVGPALDPSGQRLVYATADGYFVSSIDGSSTTRVPSASPGCGDVNQAQPQWTPDGKGVLTDANCDIQLSFDLGSGWQGKTVIDWPGRQFDPTMSPDGTHIAFLSNTDMYGRPVSSNYPNEYAVFESSPEGMGIFQDTYPDHGSASGVFPQSISYSPDGNTVAFAGYDNDGQGGSDSEIYSTVGDGVTQLTEDTAQEWGVDWLADGRIAFGKGVATQTSGEFRVIRSDGTDESSLSPTFNDGYHIGSISGREIRGSGGVATSWVDELLDRYRPDVRYDVQETIFADSAAEITDYAGQGGIAGNTLRDSNGSVLAGHSDGFPVLSLDFLGSPYSQADKTNDYLDEGQDGVDYSVAANTMRDEAGGGYRDKTYGRVVHNPGWLLWLQYWLFYYAEPLGPPVSTGAHEGDWEMVQYGLDPTTFEPQVAVYSQGGHAERCNWSSVPQQLVQVFGGPNYYIPVVYVGAGSHSNFFTKGSSGQDVGEPFSGVTPLTKSDQHNGNGLLFSAWPWLIDVTNPPSWMRWPGYWGATRPTQLGTLSVGSTSPKGPLFHPQWSDPDAYGNEAASCSVTSETPSAASSASAPAAPTALSARIGSGVATINYGLDAMRAPVLDRRILLTIQGSGLGDTPIGGAFDAATSTGTKSLPLPSGDPPYIVRASTYTKGGARSKIVSTLAAPSD